MPLRFYLPTTLYAPVRQYPWLLPALVIFGLLLSVSEGIGIGLLIPFVHQIMGGVDAAQRPGPFVEFVESYARAFREENRLPLIALSIFGLVVFKSCVVYANSALSAWASGRTTDALRRKAFRQLLTSGFGWFAQREPGQLLNTLTTQTWRVGDALGMLSSIVVSSCTILVFTVLLLLISWPLTVTMAAGVLLALVLVNLVTVRAREVGEQAVETERELSERSVQAINGMRIIRAFCQEEREFATYERASDAVRRAYLRVDLLSSLTHPLLELIYVPLFIGALLLAWHFNLGAPTLFAFLLLLYRLQPQVGTLASRRVHLASLFGSLADVEQLVHRSDSSHVISGSAPYCGLGHAITLEDVSFAYSTNGTSRLALEHVSFEITKGKATAIVGASGAGKSTLVNLLYRFYDPKSGTIRVDGQPLCELELSSWRRRLALAGQDVDLFSGTIAENISYAVDGADADSLRRAAALAGIDGFIGLLPEGYRTPIGDRGLRLSGGQRQRIALARALMANPEILILDEATNAVDSESELIVQQTLERFAGNLTVIVIAHRLSTIQIADRVVVLDEGRVVEVGAPADLLSNGGALTRLYKMQATALTS